MRGIGKAGLCALALTAFVAAGCGSDDDEKSASSDKSKPARGFEGDDNGPFEFVFWTGKDAPYRGLILFWERVDRRIVLSQMMDNRDPEHCKFSGMNWRKVPPHEWAYLPKVGETTTLTDNWHTGSPSEIVPGSITATRENESSVRVSWPGHPAGAGKSCDNSANDVLLKAP